MDKMRHCKKLFCVCAIAAAGAHASAPEREAGVSTVLQCWYFGNCPDVMNKAAGELAFETFADDEESFLRRIAAPEWRGDAARSGRATANSVPLDSASARYIRRTSVASCEAMGERAD